MGKGQCTQFSLLFCQLETCSSGDWLNIVIRSIEVNGKKWLCYHGSCFIQGFCN